MTKRELRILKKAMWYLHTDEEEGGDYNSGMDLLCKLRENKSRQLKTSVRAGNSQPVQIMAIVDKLLRDYTYMEDEYESSNDKLMVIFFNGKKKAILDIKEELAKIIV